MEWPPADQTPLGVHYELSTHLIAREIIRRGYQPRWMRRAMFVVQVAGRTYGWNMTRCTVTSTIGAECTTRKDYSRTLLRRAGLAVADGASYRPADHSRALARAEELGWPVMVKPATWGKGRGVALAHNRDEFLAAWQAAGGPKLVVERPFVGREARFLTVAGRCVAVAGRIPAHVVGDGRSTVAELVKAKNAARQANPHLAAHQVPLTGDPELVPAAGLHMTLDHRGGFSTGADSVDLTETVHPSWLDVAGRAERAFPGLGLAGVDIIARDYAETARPDNHIVLEVNSRPAIGAHHYPWEGKPRDVAAAIVDGCAIPHRRTTPAAAAMPGRVTTPRVRMDPGDTVTIEGEEGSASMSIPAAQELARRLLEWLGEPEDEPADLSS